MHSREEEQSMISIQKPHREAYEQAVTVSIVSHGQADLVRKLLVNLNEFSSAGISCVIVTLNIAEPDLHKDLILRFPVKVLSNPRPKGFGANHNAAFASCTTPWFLVLNPDIELTADPIAPLIASATPTTGMLAPRILEPGHSQPEPYRNLLTPAEIVTRRLGPVNAASRAEWVPGMFMLLRAEVFALLKGFDERYFMYVEDADLCARLQLAGWQITVVELVTVIHDARRASWRQWRALSWHIASLVRWWTSRAFWRTLRSRYQP
jgi:N-acetylglucosaminyl-diphospho-decaprenol L-rhamnosyltransferase